MAAYVPSFSELMQGGNPALGTVQPGVNYGDNKGIDLLFRAATRQAEYAWEKHKEIQQRKKDFFTNLNNLESVSTMPEDKPYLKEKMGALLKQMLDPGIFTGSNPQALAQFESDLTAFGHDVYTSKQDLLNFEADKKTIAENEEYQNNHNNRSIESYRASKLGERKYDLLTPTPKFDLKMITDAAAVDVVQDEPSVFEVGNVQNSKDGKTQEFVLAPNGAYERVTSGGKKVDTEKFLNNAKGLAYNPRVFPGLKAFMDFQLEELPPEQQAQYKKEDGTVDYDKIITPLLMAAAPKAVAPTVETKYGRRAEVNSNNAADIEQEKLRQAGADRRAKWDNETELTKSAKNGDITAQQIVSDAKTYADRLYTTISSGKIKANGKTIKGVSINALSPEDKQVMGLLDKDGALKEEYKDKDLYLYIGRSGGIALAEKSSKDGGFDTSNTVGSYSLEGLKSARISFALKNSAGKEYGAYGELNPGGPPPPATSSSSSSSTGTKTRTYVGLDANGNPVFKEN